VVEEGRNQDDLRVVLDEAAEQDPNLEGAGVALTLGERDTAEGVSVLIVDVAPGSEAERAGLAAGDALLSVDGAAVDSMAAARQKLNGKAGTDVVVSIERAGEQQSFRVRREPLGR
jgi:carboxyl-terminal processing protease